MSHNCYAITFALPRGVANRFLYSPGVEKLSLREIIADLKSNKYRPPLSEVIITNHNTGKTYTMEEIDRMLNN